MSFNKGAKVINFEEKGYSNLFKERHLDEDYNF